MKPIDADAEWIANAQLATEEAQQGWRASRSIVLMPDVEVQPVVDLLPWRVIRLTADTTCYDLLVGFDAATRHGRVSTPIQAFDEARAEATTRSGRIYRLAEAPAYSDDGEYVLQTLFGRLLTDSNHCDVSNEYWDAIRAAAPASATGPDGNDSPLS